MKIALVTDGIYPFVMGGMQKHSYYLAKYLALNKISIELYHYKDEKIPGTQNPFNLEELKYINLIEIKYPKTRRFPGHYLYKRYLYSKKIYKLIKDNNKKYDFIYAKGFSSWAILRHLNKNSKPLVGVNFHGYEMFQRWPSVITGIKLQILKLPVQYIMKKADFLFSYGGQISSIISAKGFENKIVEIPTGISSDWLLSKDYAENQEIIRFVYIGRYERRKGIEELTKSIEFLLNKHDFVFHFIGPIPQEKRIIANNVIYHGQLHDIKIIKNIVSSCDILVTPSYSEGMPNVILEGMALKCAVIATDVGAISNMVDHTNGWLLQPGNRYELIEALTNAIELTKFELEKKQNMSYLKVRNNFTWEKVIMKYINFFNDALLKN